MPEFIIKGVPVDFPFTPYDVQRVYMEKVIECLQRKVNGVLESPTGTGKTLSLLCASLGWLRVTKAQMQANAAHQRTTPANQAAMSSVMQSLGFAAGSAVPQDIVGIRYPKIIYASRTHTQLSQALQELRRTNYAKGFKSTVIGSRDQLCIHPEVVKESNNNSKIHMCQKFVSARSCIFYNRVDEMKNGPTFTETGIMDIEDLVRKGSASKCCPYYMAKELKNDADIVFMPYNYLLDPIARKANNIELDNSVVILDEAHNVEKICEEAGSLQFRSTDVALCITEITKVMKDLMNHMETSGFSVETNAAVRDFNQDDLCLLKTMFLELEKAIDEVEVAGEGSTYPGHYIHEILGKADITATKMGTVQQVVDKLVQYLTTSAASPLQRMGAGLQKFSELLTVVFTNRGDKEDPGQSYYKLYVTYEETKGKKNTWLDAKKPEGSKKGRVLNYWCFSPSFGMRMLWQQGTRCIILTSGTLSPIPPLVQELGISVPVTLENGHVVTGEQVFVGVVSTGPDGTQLNSSFNTRNDPKYIAALGRTVQNFSRVVPAGLLVFFPSYPLMKKCQDEWQAMGIWSKIVALKAIFVESQMREAFANSMAEYYDKIHGTDGKGACFLAVCRGKVSEGLDFSDNNGRAVIITGLPYPPYKDPRVMLKQQYLDHVRTKDKTGITGQMWYQLEASRAVNQAIGRVIRHKRDFGAILLCDTRFGNSNFKQQLSAWLQPHIQTYSQFGNCYRSVIEFFKKTVTLFPDSETRYLSRQPINRASGDKEEEGLRGQAAAGFSQAPSRKVYKRQTAAIEPPPSLSTSQITSDILNSSADQSPMAPSPLQFKRQKKVGGASKGLFSAMHEAQPEQVVNFDENVKVDFALPQFTRKSSSSNFVLPSSSGIKRKLTNSQNLVPAAPTAPVSSSQSKQDTSRDYLLKVKYSLNPDEYRNYVRLVKNYHLDCNYQVLLDSLNSIFKNNCHKKELYEGFARFVKAEHKANYQKFLANLKS